MARPGEPEAVRTTIVGGRPPAGGKSVADVPRGVEVLVKKAAVDPAFKKILLEKRAAAAEAIALKLEPAEAAMLDAVPDAQLEAIVANTKVSAKLRPAFLGYAAGVMLAALGAAAYAEEPGESEMGTTGGDAETPPEAETAATAENNAATGTGTVSGLVMRVDGEPLPLENAEVIIVGIGLTGRTDECGYYRISAVPEGTYEVKVTHDEWGTQSKTDVRVITGLGTSVPFYLGFAEYFSNVLTGGPSPVYEDGEEGLIIHIRGIRPDVPQSKKGD